MKRNLLLSLAFAFVCTVVFGQGVDDGVIDILELKIVSSPILIDGDIDAAWSEANIANADASILDIDPDGADDCSATVKVVYDDINIYILAEIKDDVLSNDGEEGAPDQNDDGFEFVFDVDNSKDALNTETDFMLTVNYDESGSPEFKGVKGTAFGELNVDNVEAACADVDGGWILEMLIPIADLGIEGDFGAGIRYNDDDKTEDPGQREHIMCWELKEGWGGWAEPEQWGVYILTDEVIPDETSIFSSKIAAFKVYPNPSNNIITISNAELGAQINVLNLVGQEVLNSVVNNTETEINITNLVTGVYFVKVGDAAQKIIIE